MRDGSEKLTWRERRLCRLQAVSLTLFNTQESMSFSITFPDAKLKEEDPDRYATRKKWDRQFEAYKKLLFGLYNVKDLAS